MQYIDEKGADSLRHEIIVGAMKDFFESFVEILQYINYEFATEKIKKAAKKPITEKKADYKRNKMLKKADKKMKDCVWFFNSELFDLYKEDENTEGIAILENIAKMTKRNILFRESEISGMVDVYKREFVEKKGKFKEKTIFVSRITPDEKEEWLDLVQSLSGECE